MLIGAIAWGTLQFLEDEPEPALTEFEQQLSDRVGQLEAELYALQQPKQDVKSEEEAARFVPEIKLERFHQVFQEGSLNEYISHGTARILIRIAGGEIESARGNLPDVSPSSENEARELRELRYAVCLLKGEIKPRDIPRKICR